MFTVTSPDFNEGTWIPKRCSARGADLSPEFHLSGIDENGKTLIITLDDASHPLFQNYNHWIIWNIPIQSVIPGGIKKGKIVEVPKGAVQGIAYGAHRYKGPKPPFKTIHTYVFTVYVVDKTCELPVTSRKKAVLEAVCGHILQKATLSGQFQSRRKE